jgi:hypothetical protein
VHSLADRPKSSGGLSPWLTTAALLVLVVGILPGSSLPAEAALGAGSRIPWAGGSWYLHGANVPWYNWSCDFGCGTNGGASSGAAQTALADRFAKLQTAGVHAVRWWVFEGNAWQISRDAAGAPADVSAAVYPDFDAALQLAERYDLYYDFVLFSAPSGLPAAWLNDGTQRAKLAAALAPLFARYKGHPRILSWEVFNEPDFDVWNGKVTQDALRATVKAVADSVHANSTAYVTVGMGFADGIPMVQGLGLDYYQAHWYDYMSGGTYCMRCNSYGFYQARWNLDAPLLVGEVYTGADMDAVQRLEEFYAKGYAGAWPWSLFPEKTADKMAIDLAAMTTFSGRHADVGPKATTTDPTPTPTPKATATATATATPSPTPTGATDTTPPSVTGVRATNISGTSATITWGTDEPANSQVEYGTTTAYGIVTPLGAALVSSHAVSLAGLARNTVYHYRVRSRDAAGNVAVSGDYTFTTRRSAH